MQQQIEVESDRGPAPPRLHASRLLLVASLVWLFVGLLAPRSSIVSVYFRGQDLPVILSLVVILVLLTWRVPRLRLPTVRLRWWHVSIAAALLALLLWRGTYAVMFGHPLTRDEQMVLFDMSIFAKGHLIQPVVPAWRDLLPALVPTFALSVPGGAGVVSNYLPGNAALRFAFSNLADPALMNPVLIGLSVLALFDVARRLFPDDDRAVLVTLLLYVMSAQMLVTAMTSYAMTPHTALNLIWLALFLRDRRWSHALAMAISVLACGLHQLVFHPLFAGPLLLWRLHQGRYGLFAAYTAVFAAALMAWMTYPGFVARSIGVPGAGGGVIAPSNYLANKVMPLLMQHEKGVALLTQMNLMRYIAWQPLALLPMLAGAWPPIRRGGGLALPLAAGIVLTVVICMIMLPFQGHGWGYRYMCGVLGNGAVLGGLGYQCRAARDPTTADGVFATLSLATVPAVIFLTLRAHAFVAPYDRLERLVDSAKSDMVLVDTQQPQTGVDFIRNAPDFKNRPLRLSSEHLTDVQLAQLCQRGTISLLTRADMRRAGISPALLPEGTRFDRQVGTLLAGRPCLVPREGGSAKATQRAPARALARTGR